MEKREKIGELMLIFLGCILVNTLRESVVVEI